MLVYVKQGKFHTMLCEPTRDNVFRSAKTACGLTVEPLNYFKDAAAADSYTGGRLAAKMCKHCAGSV